MSFLIIATRRRIEQLEDQSDTDSSEDENNDFSDDGDDVASTSSQLFVGE